MRRVSSRAVLVALVSFVAALIGFGIGAGSSTAASSPYPPATCASISVSATVVSPGEPITVTGAGFAAGATVHILFDSSATVLATVKADAQGKFTVDVTMPADAKGHHTILADGQAVNCPADPIQIEFQTGPSTGPTTPAMTGVDIAMLVGIAVVLVAAGVVLAGGGRRRSRYEV